MTFLPIVVEEELLFSNVLQFPITPYIKSTLLSKQHNCIYDSFSRDLESDFKYICWVLRFDLVYPKSLQIEN